MGFTNHYHPLVGYLVHQWRGKSSLQKVCFSSSTLILLLMIAWPDREHDTPSIRKTLHFPFRTGCPQDCRIYRQERGLLKSDDADDTGSRITVQWYFGEPKAYDPHLSWESQNGLTNYSRGINFECPQSFVQTFQAAANDMRATAIERLAEDGRGFRVHPQKQMHASLSYLCCLQGDEIEKAFTVIDKWIEETTFDFTLRFTEIESWWESPNSVTNIVLVDPASQRTMMALNHDLNHKLEASGVPVLIPRKDQMPFHSTLAGFRYSKKGETFDPKYEIESKLSVIVYLVHSISKKYKNQWNPGGLRQVFRVQHKPRRSEKASVHTQPLVDLPLQEVLP